MRRAARPFALHCSSRLRRPLRLSPSPDPSQLPYSKEPLSQPSGSKEERKVLIITRRPGERIMLGDDTRIHIMEIVGNSVRVGVEAPKSVPIYREEIWTAVKEENKAAAAAETTNLPRPAARA